MNTGQQRAYDAIMEGKSIFLTGPGGTGKSFLIGKVNSPTVALTALTGCASILLHPKAKTIHSWAGIGLGKDPVPLLVENVRKSKKALVRWNKTDTLVIDEISMMTPDLFEKLDQVARKILKNEKPFGGLQLVLVGDFYQLPPIHQGYVFESELWKSLNLEMYELTEIVRQKDETFQKVLNEARRGELSKESLKILKSRMRLEFAGDIKPTMLYTRRAEVDSVNMTHLKKLGSSKTFKAITLFNPIENTSGLTNKDLVVQNAIEILDKNAPYNAELILAIGAQVMLITNYKPEKGLVNGSRGIVVNYERDLPIVKFRNGLEIIENATWESSIPGVKRSQIPLKLAYAVTIHKVQGATLDCALIDVGLSTFEYGQAYVALSRVKDLESLYIHDLDPLAFRANPKVKEFYSKMTCT